MISDQIDYTRQQFTYSMAYIRVVFAKSKIYHPVTAENHRDMIQEEDEIYVLNLPVYESLGVPLDILIKELTQYSGFDFYHHQILYKLNESSGYILVGVFPFEEASEYIPIEEIGSEPIFIKCRIAGRMEVHPPCEEEKEKKSKVRRGIERKIGEVIDALMTWTRLFTTLSKGEDGNVRKYSRAEAACIVGIPKKTLDDYAFQIRLGNQNGFDFDLHSQDKIGVLREFNRRMGRARIDEINKY